MRPSPVLVPPVPKAPLAERVVTAGIWALVGLATFWLCSVLSFLLAPLGLGFIAFYTLNPVVNLLENRGVSRKAAVSASSPSSGPASTRGSKKRRGPGSEACLRSSSRPG
jgi:hypothetical protein